MEQKGLTEAQKHQAVEGNILMAMFYATCEQSEMLENKFKQREKQIFKNWKNKHFVSTVMYSSFCFNFCIWNTRTLPRCV